MDLNLLENYIAYSFTRKTLLETALQHSSFVNEHPGADLEDNERLEFLGDAILNAIISHLLMIRHPKLKEGELSKIRSLLVNKTYLAKVAKQIHLGDFLKLGKGEIQSSGRKKVSILADAFEALLGAVYLDSGFERAYALIHKLFHDYIDTVTTTAFHFDYKSQLQERAQAALKIQPEYTVVQEIGPDHDKTFEVKLNVGPIQTTGKGKSKKAAEQEAAKNALKWMDSKESF